MSDSLTDARDHLDRALDLLEQDDSFSAAKILAALMIVLARLCIDSQANEREA